MQLGLLPHINVSFVSQDINYDDKGLLVYRLVASRPDKYVDLDLTWLDV